MDASSAEPLLNPARITATRFLDMFVSPIDSLACSLVPPQTSIAPSFREQVRDFEHIKNSWSIRPDEKM
jgi:hypothetical protein